MTVKTDDARPILVPVDFSDSSRAALIWATKASAAFGAPLEILHVVHDPESDPGYYQRADPQLQRLEVAASEMMDEFVEATIKGSSAPEPLSNARRTLVVGLPVNRILEIAESSNAELIVMGSQGRTGLHRLMLGSKAERVVRSSPIPVTIVKLDQTEDSEAAQ